MIKLTLRNVGIIKEAEIEFPGLTVISGENDTGKSTVGKMVFAIVKAISKYEEYIEEEKSKKIGEQLGRLISCMRLSKDVDVRERLQKLFRTEVVNTPNKSILLEEVSKVAICIEQKEEMSSNKSNADIKKVLDNIKEIIITKKNKKDAIESSLNSALTAEFYKEINNSIYKDVSEIIIKSNIEAMYSFSIKDNKVGPFEMISEQKQKEMEYLFFNDVTFIESPAFMQINDILEKANTYTNGQGGGKYYLPPNIFAPLHLIDSARKIKGARFSQAVEENNDFRNEIIKQINGITRGDFQYNKDYDDIVFIKKVKGKQSTLRTINIATGIKTFGYINILLLTGAINANSLLVIDEPETHLHPEWQLQLAEVLIKLVKNGIPVLLTSHSPYMIQGLKYYSQKEKFFGEKTRFYLAERLISEDNWANIIDVGVDINKIFEKLVGPFNKLINDV